MDWKTQKLGVIIETSKRQMIYIDQSCDRSNDRVEEPEVFGSVSSSVESNQ